MTQAVRLRSQFQERKAGERRSLSVGNKVRDWAKNFGLGVAAAGVLTPLSMGISYLAQKVGLIEEISRGENIRLTIAGLRELGLRKFNVKKLVDAPCYLEEYIKQYNSNFPYNPSEHLNPLDVKLTNIGVKLSQAFDEEMIFRGVIQDILLTRVLKYVVKRIAPGKETFLDSSLAKISRVAFISIVFSTLHFQNQGLVTDAISTMQVVNALILGIGLGLLKESKVGFFGSVAAHITHNLLCLSPDLISC